MKVTGVFLLITLALLCLSGNARADVLGRQAICSNRVSGCSRNYKPVCGTDGNTYSNECMLCMENRNHQIPIRIQKLGPC